MAPLAAGLRTSPNLTTSKNDAQVTFGLTVDPSFQQMMAAVPPSVGYGREAGCRRVADAITTSLTPPPHARYGGATKAREASHGIEDIAEHAHHTDVNTTREHYIVPSTEASQAVA